MGNCAFLILMDGASTVFSNCYINISVMASIIYKTYHIVFRLLNWSDQLSMRSFCYISTGIINLKSRKIAMLHINVTSSCKNY